MVIWFSEYGVNGEKIALAHDALFPQYIQKWVIYDECFHISRNMQEKATADKDERTFTPELAVLQSAGPDVYSQQTLVQCEKCVLFTFYMHQKWKEKFEDEIWWTTNVEQYFAVVENVLSTFETKSEQTMLNENQSGLMITGSPIWHIPSSLTVARHFVFIAGPFYVGACYF